MSDTNSLPPGEATPSPVPLAAPPQSRWEKINSAVQFLVALGLTSACLAYLLIAPGSSATHVTDVRPTAPEPVAQVGPGIIRVDPATPLGKKLKPVDVVPTRISSPVLTVTGVVAASLRPGTAKGPDYWQFNLPEVLTSYTDWQKAEADIAFTQTQLTAIRELAEARRSSQQKVVNRFLDTVKIGTDSEKDLAAAQAVLKQMEVEGRKDVYEAETAVRVARRSEASSSRQLQLFGLDPDLLKKTRAEVDIVMADVPESYLTRVKAGQGCVARFFGIPDKDFPGTVTSIAPVLSKERRSLRVLFTVHDPHDELRPGMFAEIGLGTDAREALLIPSDGVVHVGRTDYVLAAAGPKGEWRVTPVEVGDSRGELLEVHKGLRAGDTIIGAGAILLKPAVVRATLPVEAAENPAAALARPAIAVGH